MDELAKRSRAFIALDAFGCGIEVLERNRGEFQLQLRKRLAGFLVNQHGGLPSLVRCGFLLMPLSHRMDAAHTRGPEDRV